MDKLITETPRLLMREFNLSDVNSLFELNADKEVVRYVGNKAYTSKEEVRDFIIAYDQYEKHGFGRWTVILKSTNEFLGWCGLRYEPEIGNVDLGYRFHKRNWGKGYATEASLAALQIGFEKSNIEKIVGRALIANTASIHVLEKVGMKFEKEIIAHGEPAVLYSINKKSWQFAKTSTPKLPTLNYFFS